MYLFVFVFLIIGLLGIYTQVFAVQTAQLFANQKGAAQLMTTWHSAEVSLGKNIVHPALAASASCTLTYGLASPCTTDIPGNPATVTLNNAGGTINSYTDASSNAYPHLPKGYNAAYAWNSVLFTDAGGQNYVVTWAPPPASGKASDPITTPSIGITGAELFQQLRNAHTELIGYGTVSGGVLRTGASLSSPVSFTMPAVVPNNSVALISLL